MNQNKFIAIEGLDGAGKSTQVQLLIQHLKSKGIKTKFVHFPRYQDGYFGPLISRYLRGELGAIEQVHPQLVALLFAEDRKDFAPQITKWLDDDYVVIVDRYVLSNIAYQCAKTKGEEEKIALSNWIFSFEYEYNKIPQPDITIYLDVPFTFTEQSLTQKRTGSERNYLNKADDIHEKDMAFQFAVKNEYEKLLVKHKSLNKINCVDSNNAMKTREEIHHEIVIKVI